MSDSVESILFRVERRDDFGDSAGTWGTISCGADGILQVVEAGEPFASILTDIVAAVNAEEVLRTKVPPAADSAVGGVAWRDLRRDDLDFTFFMPDYVEQKYGLTLSLIE